MHKAIMALTGLVLPIWAVAGQVDINAADAATLARELKGVGAARAQAIIEHRERNGRFKSVDDILKVRGIGAQVLEENRDVLSVREAAK